MPNTAGLKFQETDDSASVGDIPVGITGVQLECTRGPINRPDILITSWAQYQKLYGGLSATADDPLLAKRMLDGGTQLRINNVKHYTTISDPTSCDAVLATPNLTNGAVSVKIVGTMSAGTYTLAATGFTNGTALFNTDTPTTMAALIANFALLNPGKLYASGFFVEPANITATASNRIWMIPVAGQTIASIAITGTSVTGTTSTQEGNFKNLDAQTLFSIAPIEKGLPYNNLVIIIGAPSNGQAQYFKLTALLQTEENVTTEVYDNIAIDGNFVTSALHFLDGINNNSNIIKATYSDLSGIAAGQRLVPLYGGAVYSGGTNGSATVSGDYIGDSGGRTGWFSFDTIDDIVSVAAPNKSDTDTGLHIAGYAYVNNRQDLVYFAHLNNSNASASALVTAKTALGIDSSFGGFYGGGLKVIDPLTSNSRNISELADILAIAATSANNFGMQYSFAGVKRGKIPNALGVVNNFGTPGSYNDLNLLANRQINMVVNKNGVNQLSGNFTAQLSNSLLSFMNVRRTIIFLKLSLAPIIQPFIEDPNTIDTWKQLYMEVKPFLDGLVTNQSLYLYEWQGDQFAKNMNSLAINNLTDVNNGKYLVKLFIAPTPSMQQITINIIIVGSTITISEVLGN